MGALKTQWSYDDYKPLFGIVNVFDVNEIHGTVFLGRDIIHA